MRYGALGILCCVLARPVYSEPTTRNILPPFGHSHFCARYPRDCDQTPGRVISTIPLSMRWRVQEWINASISPKPVDAAEFDAWSLFPREGNCNDYAVTKRHVLLESGWPASSLLLAEVRLVSTGDWVLDNMRPSVVRLEDARNDYIWVRVESARNPRLWTRSFARAG
jgi:predicted transglutaminase-like cysteine proteinase